MKLLNITAPLVGGVLAVLLLQYIGKEEYFPWLAEQLQNNSGVTQIIAFIIGCIVFGTSRFIQFKKQEK